MVSSAVLVVLRFLRTLCGCRSYPSGNPQWICVWKLGHGRSTRKAAIGFFWAKKMRIIWSFMTFRWHSAFFSHEFQGKPKHLGAPQGASSTTCLALEALAALGLGPAEGLSSHRFEDPATFHLPELAGDIWEQNHRKTIGKWWFSMGLNGDLPSSKLT